MGSRDAARPRKLAAQALSAADRRSWSRCRCVWHRMGRSLRYDVNPRALNRTDRRPNLFKTLDREASHLRADPLFSLAWGS
jgi:hypothetical protein